MPVVRFSLVSLLCFAAAANAQTPTELQTLEFSPHRSPAELPLADAVAAQRTASREPSGDAAETAALLARLTELSGAIEAGQAANGPKTPDLVNDLIELAGIHARLGDHAEALAVLGQAQHIIRVQSGLYTLDQVDVVEDMIASLAASEAFPDIAPLERYLLELLQRNPDDPRRVELLTDIADRQIVAARYYADNELPPAVSVTLQPVGESSVAVPSSAAGARALAKRTLFAARRNYTSALSTAVHSTEHDVADLLALEDRVVATLYFELTNAELSTYGDDFGRYSALARIGLAVLENKLHNRRLFPGTPEAIALTLVEIADWELLSGSHGIALDRYREARRVLLYGGVPAADIAALLAPAQPVVLPAFAARFADIDAALYVAGWFDVAIGTNRYGRVVDMAIVDRSANASDAIERRFRHHVYRQRFRPRFRDGEITGRERFALRYHFGYTADRPRSP